MNNIAGVVIIVAAKTNAAITIHGVAAPMAMMPHLVVTVRNVKVASFHGVTAAHITSVATATAAHGVIAAIHHVRRPTAFGLHTRRQAYAASIAIAALVAALTTAVVTAPIVGMRVIAVGNLALVAAEANILNNETLTVEHAYNRRGVATPTTTTASTAIFGGATAIFGRPARVHPACHC